MKSWASFCSTCNFKSTDASTQSFNCPQKMSLRCHDCVFSPPCNYAHNFLNPLWQVPRRDAWAASDTLSTVIDMIIHLGPSTRLSNIECERTKRSDVAHYSLSPSVDRND